MITLQKHTFLITLFLGSYIIQAQTGIIVDIDGNEYQTVKIGDQWWMAENLRLTHFAEGRKIPPVSDKEEWAKTVSAACCFYDNLKKNSQTYGNLYNWYVTQYEGGICPVGWHVSTDKDWITMEKKMGMTDQEANGWKWRGTDQGVQLKSEAFQGSNTSGYSARGTGYRDPGGAFMNLGKHNDYWTSTPYDNDGRIEGVLHGLTDELNTIVRNYHIPGYGFCIRCVKDQ